MKINRTLTTTLAALALVLTLAGGASAQGGSQSRRVGVGGMIGDPTGLSMKFRLHRAFAIDLGAGFGMISGNHFLVHTDFLWALPLFHWPKAEMFLHFGVGPKLAIFDSDHRRHVDDPAYDSGLWVGVRAPVGLTWEFEQRRLDVFFEIAPGFWFVQDLWFDIDVAAGARFWF
jgi:hypothetical protein